jgi:hypothetical protein
MEPLPQSRNERLNHGAGSRTPPGNRPGFQPSAEPVHSDDVDRRPLGTRQSCLQKEAVCGETADNPCRVRDVYAPVDLKATFFAVMASFTNLALSANSLLTKYVNQIFLVTREVKDRATGAEVPRRLQSARLAANHCDAGRCVGATDDRVCRAEVAAQDPGLRQSCDPRARSFVENEHCC